MVLPWYATREEVKSALDFRESARNAVALDRAISGASRAVDALCHRVFYPSIATRYFSWPDINSPSGWRLWLDENELVSATTITSGGEVLAAGTDYLLEPANSGPPYGRLEINRASSNASFTTGSTPQRDIAITGTWCGCPLDSAPAGTLTAALSTTTGTFLSLSNSAPAGIGDLILIDSERMIVTGKAMIGTGQTVAAPGIAAGSGDTVLPTSSSSTANVGEVILVDAERMLVVDVSGVNLIVRRAWDGTVLAAHSAGVTINAPRGYTVVRGALGTTAATHSNGAGATRHLVPSLVNQLAVAEAVAGFLQEAAGMARTSGGGNNEFEVAAKGLTGLRRQVYRAHGRKARVFAI
jgi:hypothetical protein